MYSEKKEKIPFFWFRAGFMGEAKQNRRRKQAFLNEHQWCCYCGGGTQATTVDHVPSRQMFIGKRRPKGLEVPACNPCNQATRQHEQVAAMFGRMYPDGSTKEERSETIRIMHAVGQNAPGLLEELQASANQKMKFARSGVELDGIGGILNCSGPLLNRSIQIFGAKLGFALHYLQTGRIIPPQGGVFVRWYSNYDAITKEIPPSIFAILGEPETLRQGNWSVETQFNYAYAIADSRRMAAYFSTFRFSFAVLSIADEEGSELASFDDEQVHQPGKF